MVELMAGSSAMSCPGFSVTSHISWGSLSKLVSEKFHSSSLEYLWLEHPHRGPGTVLGRLECRQPLLVPEAFGRPPCT